MLCFSSFFCPLRPFPSALPGLSFLTQPKTKQVPAPFLPLFSPPPAPPAAASAGVQVTTALARCSTPPVGCPFAPRPQLPEPERARPFGGHLGHFPPAPCTQVARTVPWDPGPSPPRAHLRAVLDTRVLTAGNPEDKGTGLRPKGQESLPGKAGHSVLGECPYGEKAATTRGHRRRPRPQRWEEDWPE